MERESEEIFLRKTISKWKSPQENTNGTEVASHSQEQRLGEKSFQSQMFIFKMQIYKCLSSKCKYQNVYLQNANIKMFIFKMQISNFRCCKKISNLKTISSRVLRKQLLDHSTPTSFKFLSKVFFHLAFLCLKHSFFQIFSYISSHQVCHIVFIKKQQWVL